MRAIVDLVLVPLVFAVVAAALAGPWGLVLGAAVGLYVGASFGTSTMEDDRAGVERELAERDRRIAELEERVAELEERAAEPEERAAEHDVDGATATDE